MMGLLTGLAIKLIHKEDDFAGFFMTILLGIVGSFSGGAILYLLTDGEHSFHHAGILSSILGGVVFCYLYDWIRKKF